MTEKPKPRSGLAEKELDKAQEQFEAFDQNIKELTQDNMNRAPILEQEPQTKLSQREIANSKDIYLKPKRSIASKERFNEKFREAYLYDKQFVNFIAENKEIIGESINLWTKPYAGLDAEYWEVPVNKPVYGPRYLAEQIRKCTYHQLTMNEQEVVARDSSVEYCGRMVADKTVSRLTAEPVTKSRSVFVSSDIF
ncbi:MAG TPA: hypothetical protein VGK47_11085 [Nitrososphaeraceae archaeon]